MPCPVSFTYAPPGREVVHGKADRSHLMLTETIRRLLYESIHVSFSGLEFKFWNGPRSLQIFTNSTFLIKIMVFPFLLSCCRITWKKKPRCQFTASLVVRKTFKSSDNSTIARVTRRNHLRGVSGGLTTFSADKYLPHQAGEESAGPGGLLVSINLSCQH